MKTKKQLMLSLAVVITFSSTVSAAVTVPQKTPTAPPVGSKQNPVAATPLDPTKYIPPYIIQSNPPVPGLSFTYGNNLMECTYYRDAGRCIGNTSTTLTIKRVPSSIDNDPANCKIKYGRFEAIITSPGGGNARFYTISPGPYCFFEVPTNMLIAEENDFDTTVITGNRLCNGSNRGAKFIAQKQVVIRNDIDYKNVVHDNRLFNIVVTCN